MCKVFMCAGIKSQKIEKTIEFIKVMGKEMTPGNSDGLGYAAVDKNGNLFGERWLYNDTAFLSEPPGAQAEKTLQETFPGLFDKEEKSFEYTNFGEVNMAEMKAITLHTRLATSGKGMVNCHPFINNGISLIHNGVINNCDEIGMPTSSCDSEAILTSYTKNEVNLNINSVHRVVEELRGYYVAGLLAYDDQGNNVLDIIKGNNERLTLAYIKELEIFVFTSVEWDLSKVCNNLNLTMEIKKDIKGDMMIRLDVMSGKMLNLLKVKPKSQWEQTRSTKFNNYPMYKGNSNTPKHVGAKIIDGKAFTLNGTAEYHDETPSITTMSEAEVHRLIGEYVD